MSRFFEIDGEIVFSEMTFTPGGGFMSIQPEEFNDKWGNMINLGIYCDDYVIDMSN